MIKEKLNSLDKGHKKYLNCVQICLFSNALPLRLQTQWIDIIVVNTDIHHI